MSIDLSKQYVGIDVETTGLDSKLDEIVEVYARRYKEDGTLGKEFYQRCRPLSGCIPKEATAIHSITYDMVKDCPNYITDGIQKQLAEFIGDRTLTGHNLINFDIGFLKLTPKNMEDTLLMCRTKYGMGKNKLQKACEREKIKFDPHEAHSAKYDVLKHIELFIKMKNFDKPNTQQDLFKPAEVKEPVQVNVADIFTQTYSYSRINLFQRCPFAWKKRYIDKIYEPQQDHLVTGSICHKIAETTSLWCYRETFTNKFILCKYKIVDELWEDVNQYYSSEKVTIKQVGYYLFENPKIISSYLNFNGLAYLIQDMDTQLKDVEYEKVSMPDLETYNKIINDTIRNFNVIDPYIIKDVEIIMLKFYNSKDFSTRFGQISLVEKKLTFDKTWKYLSDWKSDQAFFRGILDVIEYYPDYVLITDYKTSRTMLTVEQLKRDMQLKVYALLLYKFLPPGSIKRVIVCIEYLRFGKTVEYEIENIEQVAKEAEDWINGSIVEMEQEALKDPSQAFKPKRNEYCYCCSIGDNNICPLFNRKTINNINDIESFEVATKEDCATAWKRIETNQREIVNLRTKCKTFVKNSEERIIIDEKAILDNYAKEKREYQADKVLPFFLKKGIDIKYLIPYFSISPTNVEKIALKNKVFISEEELAQISKVKVEHEFNACTEAEAKANQYLNS